MAWLTGLAGRAEALLEKVDQTAAESFSRDAQRDVIPRQVSSLHTTPEPGRHEQFSSGSLSVGAPAGRSSPLNAGATNGALPAKNRSSSLANNRPSDQKLFDFLNSSGEGGDLSLAQNASSSSLASKDRKKPDSRAPSRVASRDSLASAKPTDAVDSGHDGLMMDIGRSSSPQLSGQRRSIDDASSSIQVENQMLKEEVSALQRELHDWAGRERKSHGELSGLKKQCTQLQSDYTAAQKALQLRDTELTALRRHVAEVEDEAKDHRRSLTSLRDDRQRLLEESVASAGVQHQTLDLVENRLKEAETQLEKERVALAASQAEVSRLRQSDEQLNADMARNVVDLQRQLEQEKANNVRRQQSLTSAQSESQRCRQELEDYKQRAARILQAKEQLISKLKEGGLDDGTTECQNAELAALQEEKSLLQESLQQSKQEIDQLRMEVEELDSAHVQELNMVQEQRDQVESQLQDEQRQRSVADMEHQQKQKEMELLQDELVRQKAALHTQLKDEQARMTSLESKMTTLQRSSQNGARSAEMESRMHTLTDNLLTKQTLVETLSSEKNALLLQLEKAKQAVSSAEGMNKRIAPGHAVNMPHFEDADGEAQTRLRPMSSMMPGSLAIQDDDGIARHMRSAANTLDTFSVRLGRFLRRYPVARLFIIVYMFLLHVWVTVVLLTYQPEIHGADSPKGPHGPQ
ncbi:golgin subfamily A member 5-like [Sycon ciliatum]|uniref:golgin subfamily A member 5-like n=1 Tax=Sycon ciliatum TaxID=27933 RepID=UPI0031F6F50F